MSDHHSHYARLPYQGRVHFAAHVDVLCTISTLFGMSPAAPERCRTLELGCADGSNLIAMACHLPESEFVGIDAISGQIEAGRKMCADLKLDNITLLTRDFQELGDSLGSFDYIIAHGLFSWIPVAARGPLMALIRRLLRPEGVAYVSYNCYPGWHRLEQLRGMMLYHTRGMETAAEEVEQARAVLKFVQESVAAPAPSVELFLAESTAAVGTMSDDYIYHEYLEPDNHPIYFHQFMDIAAQQDLQYVGEAAFHAMMTHGFPPKVQQTLDTLGRTILELEQYMDFLRNRQFRNTLLTHREVTLDRAIGLQPILGFRVSFAMKPTQETPEAPVRFVHPDPARETTLSVASPLHQLALRWVASRWPASVSFSALVEHCSTQTGQPADAPFQTGLASLLLRLFSMGMCELHTTRPPTTGTISERPQVSRLARYQALHGRLLSSQRHEMLRLNPLEQAVVIHLTGTNTIAALQAHLAQHLTTGDVPELAQLTPREVAAQLIDKLLEKLACDGVLIPTGAEPLGPSLLST